MTAQPPVPDPAPPARPAGEAGGEAGELEAIRARYARRAAAPDDRYAPHQPEVLARVRERQQAMAALLQAHGRAGWAGLDIVEVGCGAGGNLQELISLGADPARLMGNDLLEDRLAQARARLPAAVRLAGGDACALPIAPASVDIVLQFTVFSSILDRGLQERLAAAMWRWLRPGGAVLWYDFVVDNPANRDVRGVPRARTQALFPGARIDARRITLAPPLARRLVKLHPALYGLFNRIPLLRTHDLSWIAKP